MAKVKICGLWRPEDILAVNEAKPDYIGFVFAKSRRQVTPEQARQLKHLLSPEIQAAGVFVNAPVTEIAALVLEGSIDLVQLHGDEDAACIKALKQLICAPVIKAIRVQTTEDILSADLLPCDFLLLDTYIPNSYGGSGSQFDWSLIPPLRHPFFLAGGLTQRDLRNAVLTGACCLDLSSAAETGGVKDPKKIKKIVNMIRRIHLCQTENLESTADSSFPKP